MGRAAPESLFSEAAALLLSPNGGGDSTQLLLVCAFAAMVLAPEGEDALLLGGGTLHASTGAGLKAVSLIAEAAREKLAAGRSGTDKGSGKARSNSGRTTAAASTCDEAAATAAVQFLVAIAAAAPCAGLAPLLLQVLHAPLLAHPKASMRKALADLASAAMAGAAALGQHHAQPAVAALVACLADHDRDAVVRAKALGLLAASAPNLAAHAATAAAAGLASNAPDSAAAAAIKSVQASVLSRLLDASKSVRRAAVGAATALVDAGAASGDAGRGWAAELLQAVTGPLLSLVDAPPASAAHDPEARGGAASLLCRLPGLVGFASAFSGLLACKSKAGSRLLLDALLVAGGPTPGPSHAPALAASAAQFDAWARTLQVSPPQAVQQLAELCSRHVAAAGPVSAAARGVETIRRGAFGALAAELGVALQTPPRAVAEVPLVAAQRMAAAARVVYAMGGVKGTGGDAACEAGILADMLAMLLPMCSHMAEAGEEAAAAPLAVQSGPGVTPSCADAVRWGLEAFGRCSSDSGALPPSLARAICPPLLAHLPGLVAHGPLRCIDLALDLLCFCCSAQRLQGLLADLEARALSPAPAPAPAAASCTVEAVAAAAAAGPAAPPARHEGGPGAADGDVQRRQARAAAAFLILLRRLAARYARAEAAFRAQLAASRQAEGCGEGSSGGAKATDAAALAASSGAPPQESYLEADAQQRADAAAAARFVESLFAEDAVPVSRAPLLAALVEDAGAPEFVRVRA